MVGSAGIAGLLAHVAFWVLLIVGFVSDELDRRLAVIFVLVWALGRFGLPHVPHGDILFTSYIAVVDVVLVFVVFKGDVRLH